MRKKSASTPIKVAWITVFGIIAGTLIKVVFSSTNNQTESIKHEPVSASTSTVGNSGPVFNFSDSEGATIVVGESEKDDPETLKKTRELTNQVEALNDRMEK